MNITVILCSHNPRAAHLERTLVALREQTLPTDNWELLVIDNASTPPIFLPATWTGSLHLRLIREATVGLVAARLRGIAEARGELLVFVDDDNVLARDYVQRAGEIAQRWPSLGAFGGRISGEFEERPSPWVARRLDRLAIREFSTEARTRSMDVGIAPCGAGLCVRACVARRYRERTLADSAGFALGRSGRQLGSGEDTDLALTACDLGLEIGRFPELKLTHLIPRERLTFGYFARLTRGHAQARLRLLALRPQLGTARDVWHTRLVLLKWALIDTALRLLPSIRRTSSRSPSAR